MIYRAQIKPNGEEYGMSIVMVEARNLSGAYEAIGLEYPNYRVLSLAEDLANDFLRHVEMKKNDTNTGTS